MKSFAEEARERGRIDAVKGIPPQENNAHYTEGYLEAKNALRKPDEGSDSKEE